MWRRTTLIAAVAICMIAILTRGVRQPALTDAEANRRFLECERAIVSGSDHAAEAQIAELNRLAPQFAPGWILRAQLEERRSNWLNATEYYSRAAGATDYSEPAMAILQRGKLFMRRLGRYTDAEKDLLTAAEHPRTAKQALELLARLYSVSGRDVELEEIVLKLIQHDVFNNFHLVLIATKPELALDEDELELLLRQDDPNSLLVAIRTTRRSKNLNSIKPLLESSIANHSTHGGLQLLKGELLVNENNSEFKKWDEALPESIKNDLRYWRIKRQFSALNQNRQDETAANWEILKRNPNDIVACYQLGQALQSEPTSQKIAQQLLERAKLLAEFENLVSVAKTGDRIEVVESTIAIANQLGLRWEAHAWNQLLIGLNANSANAATQMQGLKDECRGLGLRRTDPNVLPKIDRPMPRLSSNSATTLTHLKMAPDGLRRIQFRDDARNAGIEFQYINGGDPLGAGIRHMYELTGGGIAILDYDLDGLPDCYFAQGCAWSERGRLSSNHDRLFRNLDGTKFRDITSVSMIHEGEFGQGVSAGDLNNDGFPELLVMNIGANALLLNRGDGTFDLSSERPQPPKQSWAISGMIADINEDSIPDITTVTYLSGGDVFHRVCPDNEGIRRLTCRPHYFPADDDHCHLGVGDGTIRDATHELGLNVPDGRGMGLIFGRFHHSASTFIFIANDGNANYLFEPNVSHSGSGMIQGFNETGLLKGVALDNQGRAEACMGVAAGDVNNDGRLDLFVTNFEGESNTLYVQTDGEQFVDLTNEFGLETPSLEMLGFGTQFLDADLDGYLDLVVANGHVNDIRNQQSQYQMRPQFFYNDKGRRFVESKVPQLGGYFESKRLGRGLAVLDWNNDGKPDFAVSHLDTPAVLMTNQSVDTGHWLKLRLVGTKCSRDAIGAVATVRSGDLVITRHVTGGDGYESSNQRILWFGLNGRTQDAEVEIEWPMGHKQVVHGISMDRFHTIIEE